MSVEAGQTLSHYRLVEKIGEGGMGVVWKAEDTVLDRQVAIKVLPADVSRDDARRQLFLQEAQLAGSISDGRIVQIHEFGREAGLHCTVMEYVDGKPLTKLIATHGSLASKRSTMSMCPLRLAHSIGWAQAGAGGTA